MNLRFYYQKAQEEGENRHAQDVFERLGILYEWSTPHWALRQHWFWNCENVPDELPPYIKELTINPEQAIGHGLTEEKAKELTKHNK